MMQMATTATSRGKVASEISVSYENRDSRAARELLNNERAADGLFTDSQIRYRQPKI